MLTWVVIFLIIALVAGALGFTGLADAAGGIAEIIFFFFLILFLVGVVVAVTNH